MRNRLNLVSRKNLEHRTISAPSSTVSLSLENRNSFLEGNSSPGDGPKLIVSSDGKVESTVSVSAVNSEKCSRNGELSLFITDAIVADKKKHFKKKSKVQPRLSTIKFPRIKRNSFLENTPLTESSKSVQPMPAKISITESPRKASLTATTPKDNFKDDRLIKIRKNIKKISELRQISPDSNDNGKDYFYNKILIIRAHSILLPFLIILFISYWIILLSMDVQSLRDVVAATYKWLLTVFPIKRKRKLTMMEEILKCATDWF